MFLPEFSRRNRASRIRLRFRATRTVTVSTRTTACRERFATNFRLRRLIRLICASAESFVSANAIVYRCSPKALISSTGLMCRASTTRFTVSAQRRRDFRRRPPRLRSAHRAASFPVRLRLRLIQVTTVSFNSV